MFRNYFKTAWRNLQKGKAYSIINIAGLATGMAVALLIGLWIWDEVSFDDYFKNKKSLGQVMVTQSYKGEWYTGESNAVVVAQALRSQYAGDINKVALASYNGEHLMNFDDKKISRRGIWSQADLPEMLTLQMKYGNRNGLKDPSAILISQSLATALFGHADPLNKVVKMDKQFDVRIAGVYEDLPFNTTFYDTHIFLSWDNNANWQRDLEEWDNHCARMYVQLAPGADFEKTTAKVKNLVTPFIKEWNEELLLHPMTKMHLYSEFTQGKATHGLIRFVWLFGIIGVFVLFLACINFMNLSTARSEQRSREVGIRKTVGSLRHQLIAQFLSESVLVAIVAFVLSLVVLKLSLPFFNELSGKQTEIPVQNPLFWTCAVLFTIFTGLVAGSYPAFYLSGFKAIKVLKGTFRAGRYASLPRKMLVVTQFTVSITLIIGTIVVFKQIQHAKSRPVGYNREGLVSVLINTPQLGSSYDAIRTELLQAGAITDMAASTFSPTGFQNGNSLDWKGKDPGTIITFRNVSISHDFGKTLGWKVLQGRDFSREFLTDSSGAILSESAAKAIGFKNPIGETVKFDGKNYTIVGVVNDMLTESPYDPIEPAVYFMEGWKGVFLIRMAPHITTAESLAKMKAVFQKYNPDSPFAYKFVDDQYAKKFANEERISSLATFFASLAIFISCLGLFGLASFVAEKRTKEIGVRKVLGASVFIIWRLLSKDFVLLVLISMVISIPIAYYFMSNWLTGYNYHTDITWWIFAVTGLGAILITLITVSFQAIKAALSNPVKALRSE
jgi:ABC-type antimicrobial peptide transport system permease subunit